VLDHVGGSVVEQLGQLRERGVERSGSVEVEVRHALSRRAPMVVGGASGFRDWRGRRLAVGQVDAVTS
jgi:hypothetical protein